MMDIKPENRRYFRDDAVVKFLLDAPNTVSGKNME
jgi:hypothetical protein